MRRRLRQAVRQLLAAAGTLTLAGMALTAAAPAQAAPVRTASVQAAQAKVVPAHAKPARMARDTPAAPAVPDTKPVCGAIKPGFSTCMSLLRTNVRHYKGVRPAAAAQSATDGYGPAQLRSAYDLPSATAGTGETVAIVDAYDDPAAEADLRVYRASYGLPVCDTANGCFEKVNQDGLAAPLPPAAGTAGDESYGWDVEESLDIDMVSAICPNCRILLVEANSGADADLYQAEDTAVALGAKFVSNSWGGLEYPGETADDVYFNHPGVAITVASGDYGYGALYPAASQYVTSAGGTSLSQGSNGGWAQVAWDGASSGCSFFEPKPAWQTDSGCPRRTVADVSADADPVTGVAIYDSYSQAGWSEAGGTSVAAPIIAASYALAGPPAPGTYPASYPYAHSTDLTDVTVGYNSEDGCTPSYLCEAGPGYNGPTGLGTPDGVGAFSGGEPYGTVSGTISGPSGPLAGATVTAGGGYPAVTNADGDYTVAVPDGTYTVSAEAPGYRVTSVSDIAVTQNQASTENLTLTRVSRYYTLSGTVSDGSGHGWPLYALIGVSGHPAPVFTNPATGRYSVSLPEQGSYTLTVAPLYPGYSTVTTSVSVGSASVTRNIRVALDAGDACGGPGYAYKYTGSTQTFTGWSTTPEDGWTVVDNAGDGDVWSFDNPEDYPPPPGSTGAFASVESFEWPDSNQDTSLVSPVISLSRDASPAVTFDTSYYTDGFAPSRAEVDLSLDGGERWAPVWGQLTFGVSGLISIPIPQAAGRSDVRVRFHYTAQAIGLSTANAWEVDNVFVGNQACSPTAAGLVTGVVTDRNTGKPIDGASVTSDSHPSQSGTSASAPDNPNVSGGLYWLVASPGTAKFTARGWNYVSSARAVDVTANAVTSRDWSLSAGGLALSASVLSVSQVSGTAVTKKLTFTGTGTAPVQVQLSGQGSEFTAADGTAGDEAAAGGAPLEKIKIHGGLPAPSALLHTAATPVGSGTPLQATPSGTAWTAIPDYPVPIEGNAVGYDPSSGDVYSAGGNTGVELTNEGYVYDPLLQQWSPIASLPVPLVAAPGAFLHGKFYVIGGAAGSSAGLYTSSSVYAYNPASDSWSAEASLPTAQYSAATAELNGSLYVVGGCTSAASCGYGPGVGTDAMYRYDPAANRWTALASYPVPDAAQACAGIDEEIVCAGGFNTDTGGALKSTYIYNPASNTWSQGADMPYENFGMVYGGSGNMLQVAGGAAATEITNQAAEYDPFSNSWSALPNANVAEMYGGGGCGLYQLGGDAVGASGTYYSQAADVLPGYDQCGGPETIPWLSASSSSFTLNPGQSKTVTVTTKATTAADGQPGSYTAELVVQTNTPYRVAPIDVTMKVLTPSTWSEVKGTVTDAGTGEPLAGATVQICTKYNKSTGACGPVQYTLTTGTSGDYALWLNRSYNPLQVVVAMGGYEPASKVADLVSGTPVTVNFALRTS
jgi:N-acetylneuraminic acid mutarotase